MTEVTKKPSRPGRCMKVRLPDDLHEWIKRVAETNERPMNYIIVQAVKAYKQQREI